MKITEFFKELKKTLIKIKIKRLKSLSGTTIFQEGKGYKTLICSGGGRAPNLSGGKSTKLKQNVDLIVSVHFTCYTNSFRRKPFPYNLNIYVWEK